MFRKGEVEALLFWPSYWRTFLEKARCHSYRYIDKKAWDEVQGTYKVKEMTDKLHMTVD